MPLTRKKTWKYLTIICEKKSWNASRNMGLRHKKMLTYAHSVLQNTHKQTTKNLPLYAIMIWNHFVAASIFNCFLIFFYLIGMQPWWHLFFLSLIYRSPCISHAPLSGTKRNMVFLLTLFRSYTSRKGVLKAVKLA